MSDLPIVERLADAQDDAERAAWLLSAPVFILVRELLAIRAILRARGCHWGVSVLDVEVACASARRDPESGELPIALRAAQNQVRQGLAIIARRNAPEGFSNVSL